VKRSALAIVLPFLVLCALGMPAAAGAVTLSTDCAPDPGPINPSITNDAAIEVHALTRDLAADCAAMQEGRDEIMDRLELVWVGVWFVGGVLLVGLIAPLFIRAFRFWT
jgi:hypothetical protein